MSSTTMYILNQFTLGKSIECTLRSFMYVCILFLLEIYDSYVNFSVAHFAYKRINIDEHEKNVCC